MTAPLGATADIVAQPGSDIAAVGHAMPMLQTAARTGYLGRRKATA